MRICALEPVFGHLDLVFAARRAHEGLLRLDAALVLELNPGWHAGTRDVLAPIGPEAGRTESDKAN